MLAVNAAADRAARTIALLFCGLEGPGIGNAFADAQKIAIPMRSRVESLNAAQTLNIALLHSLHS